MSCALLCHGFILNPSSSALSFFQEAKEELLKLRAEKERLELRNKRLQEEVEARDAALASAKEREAQSSSEAAASVTREAEEREKVLQQLQATKALASEFEAKSAHHRSEKEQLEVRVTSLEEEVAAARTTSEEVRQPTAARPQMQASRLAYFPAHFGSRSAARICTPIGEFVGRLRGPGKRCRGSGEGAP